MTAGLTGDLRHAIRQLIEHRSFTIPAIAGLALSLGATTAVFSVVHTMLLRSPGFSSVERIVTLWQTEPKRGQKHVEVCMADFRAWLAAAAILSGVAAIACLIPAWRAGALEPARALARE